jgi:uncharacterized protein (TIGR02246 family)
MSTRSVLLGALALTLVSLACQPPAQEAGPLSEEDVAAIEQLDQDWWQAFSALDGAAMAEYFTEDAVWLPPGAPALEGRAAIVAFLTADEFLSSSYDPVTVEGRADLAYVRGTYTLKGTMAGQTFDDVGKYVEICKKQPDGSWLVSVLIWNSDPPRGEEGSGT